MILFYFFFIIIISLPVNLFSQVKLVNESVKNNRYELQISLDPLSYKIKKYNNLNIIEFINYFDESDPANFSLPKSDIFIALPPGSKPEINVKVLKRNKINAEPELNPSVRLSKDSTLKYSDINSPVFKNPSGLFELKGYLRINNIYTMHLQLNHYTYSYAEKAVYENSEFQINLIFKSGLISNIRKGFSPEINKYIINKNFAGNFIQQPAAIKEDTSGNWIDYSKTYLKIGVFKDGIYRINYDDLYSLGINLATINPKTFSLYNKGEEKPLYIFGEEDDQFNPGDFIEFPGIRNMGGKHREVSPYGQPYNEFLGRYTDTTIYWLTWGGNNGLRADIFNGNEALIPADTLKYYNEVIHIETNNWFDFSEADLVRRELPFWTENKTWFEGQVRVGTRNISFNVSDVYPDKPFYMFTKVQDYASNININAHLLGLGLNNFPEVYDSTYIDRYETAVLKAELNSTLLNNGSNTLKIHSFPTPAAINSCQLDWSEIEYPRYLYPYDDSLNFSFPFISGKNIYAAEINNINSSSVSLWKFGAGSFRKYIVPVNNNRLVFTDTITSAEKFFLSEENKIGKPLFYYVKQFKNLRDENNRGDYLAITHKKFLSNVEEYSNFVSENYNLETDVIDIDDIYDEFSFGYFNPEAIKDFLKAANNNWQLPSPEYVALIGAATYDYYGNKTKNFGVPKTYNYVPSFGASVSDSWFITWDTTGAFIPQMKIGRIPVNSVEEFQRYFAKHINHLSGAYNEWNKKYIFFSGGTTSSQQELDQLKSVNDFIINNYVEPAPVGGKYHHFYRTLNPPANFGPFTQNEVQTAINEGAVVISYLGHSGTRTWDNSIVNHTQLKNMVNRNPLITDFGCSTARFAEPDIISFSQLFVLGEEGQAINYIGNSSLGFLSTSVNAPKIFYKKIFQDSVYNVSQALNETKTELLQTFGSSNIYQIFTLTSTLIGDPVISLQIPVKPNLVIKSDDISFEDEIISDSRDSVNALIKFNNLGRVTSDSVNINIKNEFRGAANFSNSIKRKIPFYADSVSLNIPVKNSAGEHKLFIEIDPDNEINEIYENDNNIIFNYFVASSSLRNNLEYNLENRIDSSVIIFNPVLKPAGDSIVIQISSNENFLNSDSTILKIDTFYTRINLSDLNIVKENRYWLRAKIKGENTYSSAKSFFYGTGSGFYLNDNVSFNNIEKYNLKYRNNALTFDTLQTVFQAFSAGFNDGNTALVLKDGVNFIPENTLGGHHVCLFKDSTYEFISYNRFTASDENYITFLDTLDNSYIVIIAVSDNGPVSNVILKNQIKTLGSIFIDSLKFRGSWAIIGKKGASPGSVPEKFSDPFEGSVEIIKEFKTSLSNGFFITPVIGPAAEWKELNVVQNVATSDDIKYRIIALKDDEPADTLEYPDVQAGKADLSSIDAKVYPRIKLKGEFSSENNIDVSSVFVEYKSVPEIGVNYQTVSVSEDTIESGESNELEFTIFNAGKTSADSFKVKVDLLKSDNTTRNLFETDYQSIPSFGKKDYHFTYNPLNSDGSGDMAFLIYADTENSLTELFKDNNIYRQFFSLKSDTTTTSVSESTFSVTFDGKNIFDGDYVSSTPEIKMELNYPVWFPYDDTSAVQFYLGNKQVFFSEIDEQEFDTVNRKINYIYKPTLISGEYTLRVFGVNSLGQLDTSPGIEKIFLVSEDTKLLNVYNYPNPFRDHTNFTFKLTQIPDELFINIYTINGRLIRQIKKYSSELTTDFNYIEWDGLDQDGDRIANGIYLYKIIIKKNGENHSVIQKLAVVR